ncbi:hypothetical protein OH76DRAFT_1398731 [Lentinus brumalis]|uniref:F-box domain-containing protein n=1 Tax=Lentinus brumalis TaxID=2498619 RepID=A0A371DM47_9APHY|nr:hypothetical protein OH76DRAFT_1398731 [Polyporus brumalis]
MSREMIRPVLELEGQHVHQQITFHAAEVERLKQLYNAHSAVTRLPSDLLSVIFTMQATTFYNTVVAQWDNSGYGEPSHRPIYLWIDVSQVCRHWRKVALDCPELWTTVVLDERVAPELVRTVITRSCGLPLNVVVNASEEHHCVGGCAFKKVPEDCYSAAIGILKEILPRTATIVVFIAMPNHNDVWEALTCLHGAAKLEDLYIEAVGWQPYSLRRGTGVIVPMELPSQPLPVLRRLRLREVRLEWSSRLLASSLRHLDLAKCETGYESHLGDMLTALRCMTGLESMSIDAVPYPLADAEYELVPMPHLQQLRVPADEAGAQFVSHLLPPSTTCIIFFDDDDDGSDRYYKTDPEIHISDDVLLCMRAAVDHLLKGMVVYAISYEFYEDMERRCNSSSSCRIWAADEHRDNLHLPRPWASVKTGPCRLQFDNTTLHGPLLTRIISATDLRHVHTINYLDADCDGARVSMETLRGAKNVLTLRMSGDATFAMSAVLAGWTRPACMDGETRKQTTRNTAHKRAFPPDWIGLSDVVEDDKLASGIVEDSDAPPADTEPKVHDMAGSQPLFPHLRTLSFFQVDFKLREGEKGYMFDRDVSTVFRWCYSSLYGLDVKGFVECLRRRATQGASPIECLEFDACQCREREELIPLVRAVDEVRWDGRRLRLDDGNTVVTGRSVIGP